MCESACGGPLPIPPPGGERGARSGRGGSSHPLEVGVAPVVAGGDAFLEIFGFAQPGLLLAFAVGGGADLFGEALAPGGPGGADSEGGVDRNLAGGVPGGPRDLPRGGAGCGRGWAPGPGVDGGGWGFRPGTGRLVLAPLIEVLKACEVRACGPTDLRLPLVRFCLNDELR